MTLHEHVYDMSLSSVVAAAYLSATSYAYFTFPPECENVGAYVRIGDVTNTGNFRTKLQHSVEGGASADWRDLGELPTVTTSSAVATLMSASSLLPYGRVAYIVESTHASGTIVSTIVGKVLTELK